MAFLAFAAIGSAAVFGSKALDSTSSATREQTPGASADAAPAPLDPTASKTIGLRGRTPAGDDVFGKRRTDFTVALDRGQEESALLAPDVAASIGEKPATALAAVVSAAKSASNPFSDAEKVATELEIAVARLDESLLAAGLPYFVDSSVRTTPANKRLVLLYGFSIVATSTLASADASVRTVRLRRLDQLNWRHRLLGLVREHRAQAVVLLDQLDRELVELLLPSLAPNAPMTLSTDDAPEDAVVAFAHQRT